MKVALYHPWIYLKGGIERTILEINRRSRHDWTIYTSHHDPAGTFPELAGARIVELPRVSVRRNMLAALAGAISLAARRLDPAGHEVLVISCDGLGDLLTLRNGARPIVCLCFTPLRAAFDPLYQARMVKGMGPKRHLVRLAALMFRIVDRLCWRRYVRVAAVSDTVRQRIAAGRLREASGVEILHPGIDSAQIAPSRRNDRYFLVAGRIMWTKNIELAIEAFAIARARINPGFRLVIAGHLDAKSRSYFNWLATRAGEIGAVEFRAGPSDAVLRELYEGCTALLFTAFNEDWGLVPLEAMAAGKPVVAVDSGGPRESVRHGETGFLAPASPAAFAECMVRLASEPGLAERMGEAGARRVHQFTWEAFVAGLDRMVDEAAATGSASSNRRST
jgi:glycosyltransferase involved in cell wall biosynthesis